MFPSRRRPFNTESPVTGENLTGYDERYELPADNAGAFGYSQDARPAQNQNASAQPSLFGQNAFGQAQQSSVGAATAVAAETVKERPMVFALRAFSDMFVYEYSDRFEYYRRTPDGMVRCNTEYKQAR